MSDTFALDLLILAYFISVPATFLLGMNWLQEGFPAEFNKEKYWINFCLSGYTALIPGVNIIVQIILWLVAR